MNYYFYNHYLNPLYWKDKKGIYWGCNEFVLKLAGIKNEHDIIRKTDFELPWNDLAEQYSMNMAHGIRTPLTGMIYMSKGLSDSLQVGSS